VAAIPPVKAGLPKREHASCIKVPIGKLSHKIGHRHKEKPLSLALFHWGAAAVPKCMKGAGLSQTLTAEVLGITVQGSQREYLSGSSSLE
jgi:hypothetical protein